MRAAAMAPEKPAKLLRTDRKRQISRHVVQTLRNKSSQRGAKSEQKSLRQLTNSEFSLIRDVPDVQEFCVSGGGDFPRFLPRGAVQCGADLFFRFRQLSERNFQRGSGLQIVQILQDCRNDFFVLSIPAHRNIGLHHRSEVRRSRFCRI